MSVQPCPAADCDSKFAPALLPIETDGGPQFRCPECRAPVAPCPACETLVLLGVVWELGACPACETPRRDLALDDGVVRDD